MKSSLICIDMQDYFGVNPLLKVSQNVKKEILQSITNNNHILFVEYENYGPTIPYLMELIADINYPLSHIVYKNEDDGSPIIANTLKIMKIPSDHLRIVGVNTDCCVYQTVSGLVRRFPTSFIEVIENACDSLWSGKSSKSSQMNGISSLKRLPNVRIL